MLVDQELTTRLENPVERFDDGLWLSDTAQNVHSRDSIDAAGLVAISLNLLGRCANDLILAIEPQFVRPRPKR